MPPVRGYQPALYGMALSWYPLFFSVPCHINLPLKLLIGRNHKEFSLMDDESLRNMMEQNHVSAFGWALYCCGGDREEAEEVLHSAYVQILEKGLQAFKGNSSFKTWLFSIIKNTAKRRRFQVTQQLRKLQGLIFKPPAAARGVEACLRESESRNRILDLLGNLSQRQRQVLQLVFYHDMTLEEAAAVMEVSVGSARTHYSRGKDRLREEMRKAGWNNE